MEREGKPSIKSKLTWKKDRSRGVLTMPKMKTCILLIILKWHPLKSVILFYHQLHKLREVKFCNSCHSVSAILIIVFKITKINLHYVNHKPFNPSHPNLGRREKINLNYYFHTSLWCLKLFYEGFWRPSKPFWGTTKKCENKNLS